MALILEEFSHPGEIPPLYDPLFDQASAQSLFLSKGWFTILADFGIYKAGDPHLLAIHDEAAQPVAVFPLLLKGRRATGLSNYYTLRYAPLADQQQPAEKTAGALARFAEWIAEHRVATVQFAPLLPDDPYTDLTETALRDCGFHTARYRAGVRHYQETANLSADDYEARLPSRLRNTITRRRGDAEFQLFRDDDALDKAVATYLEVYHKSWKPPEPNPDIILHFAALCAEHSALRMGLLSIDGRPAAAQLWLVENGRATIYKLAHNNAFRDRSPGSVLTLEMIRAILETDRPDVVDFGLGDEAFKRDWMPQSEALIGLAAFNTSTIGGTLEHLRHGAGQLIKRANVVRTTSGNAT